MSTAADRELGSTLRALREDAGLGLGAMARRVHFSASHLCNVEKGKRRPTPAVIRAYREALGITDEKLLAPAKRRRDRLAARRQVLGHTQESLAEVLDVAVSTVARWEQGVGRPLPSVRRPLAEALAVSLDELDHLLRGGDELADLYSSRAGEAEASPGEESATRRREFIGAAAAWVAGMLAPGAAPRLGAEDVERLRATVRSLSVLGTQLGGGAVLEQAQGHLRAVRRLLETAQYGLTTGRRLQVVAGELTEEVGWLMLESGRPRTARRVFTEALPLAELSGSAQLKTLILSSLTFHATETGSCREAVDLADATQRAAQPVVTAKLSSLLAAREALIWAHLNEPHRCGVSLAHAERMLDDEDDAEEQEWLGFWGPASFHHTVGSTQLLLGEPRRAVPAARSAVAAEDRAYPRKEVLHLALLAHALAAQGDVDESAAVASEALARLDTISSGQVRDRLRAVRASLEPHRTVPGVSECVDRLARV